MKKAHIAAAALLALGTAPAGYAGVGAGDLEAGVGISLIHSETTIDTPTGSSDSESDTGIIGGNVGYFFTDIFEAKLAISGIVSSAGGTKTTQGSVNPGVDAVFLATRGTVAPFVGVSYGLAFGDTVGGVDSDYYEGHGGVKIFIRERTSLEIKLSRFEAVDSAAQTSHTDLGVGLNVYF
jgi:hypothetical protein